MKTSHLIEYCQRLKTQGLYRQRRLHQPGSLNFSSNDYLSLRDDPQVKKAYQKAFNDYPAGSGGSPLVTGFHASHQRVEQAFANALGVEAALLVNSGYVANLALISLLARLDCHILIDKANHASIYDGLQLADAPYTRVLHGNTKDLAKKLATNASIKQAFITEAVFSMSGHLAPLVTISSLCTSYHTALLVDEAHSFGLMGPSRLGAVAAARLTTTELPLRMIAAGKSLGGQGAILAGDGVWIDTLLQTSRAIIYSTALSPAMAEGLMASLAHLIAADGKRAHLQQLISFFQEQIKTSPLTWRHSSTPIQQLQLGCPHQALYYSQALQAQGIVCQAMRPPTVTRAETGLRVVLNAHHTPEDLAFLFNALHRIYDTLPQTL